MRAISQRIAFSLSAPTPINFGRAALWHRGALGE
jgi:hypothetical protein